MPVYDYQCDVVKEHRFEAFVPVSQIDRRRACSICGGRARRVDYLKAPALQFAIAAGDREIYAQHNVTRAGVAREGEASIAYAPNSHDLQCHCEVCIRHRRRAVVTETADAGKDAAYVSDSA